MAYANYAGLKLRYVQSKNDFQILQNFDTDIINRLGGRLGLRGITIKKLFDFVRKIK